VTTTGRRPKARYRATAVVWKNSMILYGGHDGTRHLSDTHIFDLETRVWSSLLTEGPTPVPRDSHIAVVHSNSMYIFGGTKYMFGH
jgi:leucine-zipper-like transcriptional regulator 1